jgi:hypothetical protein
MNNSEQKQKHLVSETTDLLEVELDKGVPLTADELRIIEIGRDEAKCGIYFTAEERKKITQSYMKC